MTSHNGDSILMLDDEFDIMSIFILALERFSCQWLYGTPVGPFPEKFSPLLADCFRYSDAVNRWISIYKKSQGTKTSCVSILYVGISCLAKVDEQAIDQGTEAVKTRLKSRTPKGEASFQLDWYMERNFWSTLPCSRSRKY